METPYVSQIVLVVIRDTPGGGHPAGAPLMAVCTRADGEPAEFVGWKADGTVSGVCPLRTPADILSAVRALRRTAQDCPSRYATVNITEGHAVLVA